MFENIADFFFYVGEHANDWCTLQVIFFILQVAVEIGCQSRWTVD